MTQATNVHEPSVVGFGEEWSKFDQSEINPAELNAMFERYFAIFPWEAVGPTAVGFDAGCGSGRWARLVAPRVAQLHCVDASPEALTVARRNLAAFGNVEYHQATIASLPFGDGSMDFGYSLGVLHHLPETEAGIAACVRTLKPGSPLLLYLYYAFDNRPGWYRALWRITDGMRRRISRMPTRRRQMIAEAIALGIYLPLARTARHLERAGQDVSGFPLGYYRDKSFYTMRTDALDRFGTQLEQRFTRSEIRAMMQRAGLANVRFSDDAPYWCAVGIKAP